MAEVKGLVIPDLEKQFATTRDTYDLFIGTNQREEEIIFEVAQAGNAEHKKIQRMYTQKLERARRNATKRNRIIAEIIAKSILRRWRGLLDGDGNEIPCTYENRVAVLTNPTYGEQLFIQVMEAASDIDNFRDIDEEDMAGDTTEGGDEALSPERETEKNSESSSPGTSGSGDR
jgi:hypothetical protein